MNWIEIIVKILTGLAVVIPLVAELVKHVKQSVKEKNWTKLLKMVMELMQTAEGKFKEGAEKREWVLMMIKASADTINYDIDLEQIGQLIDSLCTMSKVVNSPAEKKEEIKKEAQ